MKKNLLQGMLATLLLLTFTITAQAKCYIIGNDNNWQTNKGVELPETDVEGVYEGEVEFAGTMTWYGVVDALMEGPSDWEELNTKHRYYPIADGTPTPLNTPVKMYNYEDKEGGVFLLETATSGGTYKVRVDFNKMEITVLKDMPKAFYLIGCGGTWDIANPEGTLNSTEEAGIYKGTVEFTNNQFVLSPIKDNWINVQKYTLGGNTAKANFVNKIYEASSEALNNEIAELGTYDVTLDLNRMSLLFRKAGEPTPLYMISRQTEWMPDKGIEFKQTDKEGVYLLEQADFENDNNSFTLTTALSDDWTLIEPYRYGNYTALEPNRTKHFKQSTESFASCRPGTYDVTVDMNTMSLTLYKEGYVPEYPEEIYFNGTDGTWATDRASGTLSVSNKDGLYEGYVTFAAPTFAISKALTSEPDQWDEYAKNRLGATYDQESVLLNVHRPIQATNYAFAIEKEGRFYVSVDLTSNRLLILTDEPLAEGELPGEIYTIGNDNTWFTFSPSTIIPAKEDEPGVYQGVIEVEVNPSLETTGLFAILPRLSTNWTIANLGRIGIEGQASAGESYLLEPGLTYYTTKGGQYDLEVEAGKYYITVDLIHNTMRLDTDATAIKGVKDNATEETESAPYYDLSGRKLGSKKPQQGIYIKGNKKVIIK